MCSTQILKPSPPDFYLREQSKSTRTALNLTSGYGSIFSKAMLQENGGTDSLSCTRTAVRWERKQERSFLSSWFLYEILSFRISRLEALNLSDTAQRDCMMFATFLDTLMISSSRIKFIECLTFETETNIMFRNVGNDRPMRRRRIPKEREPLKKSVVLFLFCVRFYTIKFSSFCVPVSEFWCFCVSLCCCYTNSHFSVC